MFPSVPISAFFRIFKHSIVKSISQNYIVEFFNEEDAGYIDNANVLESLVSALKCLKSK